MPKLSVIAVRLALVHLAAGSVLGSVLLAGKAVPVPAWPWLLRPAHVEALLFGFMVQLVVGVAFWILPRTASRSSGRPVALALVLLNAGVVLAGGALVWGGGPAVLGRVCEAGALAAFAFHIWPRVRAARR